MRATAQTGLCGIAYRVAATCGWWVGTFGVVLHITDDRADPCELGVFAARPLKPGAHVAETFLGSAVGTSHHVAFHVLCEVVAVEVLFVHHEHGDDVALLRCEREALVFHHWHEHEAVGRRRCVLHVLCGNQAVVAQHHIEEGAFAALNLRKDQRLGSVHLHYRHRHLRLKRQFGGYLIFVVNLGLFHRPVHLDGLVTDGGQMFRCLARAHQHVLVVRVVAVGRHMEVVVALVEVVEGNAAIVARHVLHHQRSGVVVGEAHAGIAYVRMFAILVAVDGVLVAHTNAQVALLLAHHLHVEGHLLSVSFAAVDGDAALLNDVHVAVGCVELQHHGGAVACGQRWHGGWRSQTDEVG